MNAPDGLEVFHEGERLMQVRVGMRERMAALGTHVIRPFMTEQHQAFFAQLPFVIVGSVDAEGQAWASILVGSPGFIGSPDAHHLLIRARPTADDPLHPTLIVGASIALLGIEPHTRRRNRMNGIVKHIDDDGLLVGVQQSFGNCPKYIQARQAEYAKRVGSGAVHTATALNERSRPIIACADTLFIGTAHPGANHATTQSHALVAHGVDVSHRGGKPGFVHIDNDRTLTLPDFSGNRFFNTLGNIVLNPRAGLLFIDIESGDVLYIAADAEIIFDGPELNAFAGAERLLRLTIRHVTHVVASLPLRWKGEPQLSPYLANTGSWTTT
ncbi:MAG TPA: pyridoxamine 5'-phosphate oxidase family protein [Thiobacillus sp.]|nr:MAG: flavin-nucleotide-binding protein [Hydrogenophilales bacterium 28-61-11]OYZ58269.1 MAG: flavin-nucleotide-binding protein [Hydrogenophilales bacterium 16-61-112]OZA47642.1 MAG: flavin-nucleotide-binding protein [Hydrogenophilales bacterium 17-61-76]HQT32274.1 pyridoxamine 5'-phosphate oxidase family protein [Thiobacillus sp.]HQT71758.1 pyridoxamine 5'-phosphate oxidase family protein [Thiobacillus sp.]